jgi:hypothetical protein
MLNITLGLQPVRVALQLELTYVCHSATDRLPASEPLGPSGHKSIAPVSKTWNLSRSIQLMRTLLFSCEVLYS